MDDKLARQLIRQLKLLNFWITLFGVITLIALAVIGFFMYQTYRTIDDARQKIDNTRQQLDVQQQICEDEGSFSDFVRRAGACD